MALDLKDLELIERIIVKHSDDIAISLARSFERLEEDMDRMEARIYSRITDLETASNRERTESTDAFNALAVDITGLVRSIDDRLTELLELQ